MRFDTIAMVMGCTATCVAQMEDTRVPPGHKVLIYSPVPTVTRASSPIPTTSTSTAMSIVTWYSEPVSPLHRLEPGPTADHRRYSTPTTRPVVSAPG
jgi:hypothetical protein